MDNEINNGIESKYNTSIDVLERVNKLIDAINYTSAIGDLQSCRQWQLLLDALEREVWPYIDETERAALAKQRAHPISDAMLNMRDNNPQAQATNKLRAQLSNWERNIRIHLVKKGMQVIGKERVDSHFFSKAG